MRRTSHEHQMMQFLKKRISQTLNPFQTLAFSLKDSIIHAGIGIELQSSGLLSTAARLDRELKTNIPFQLICTISGPSQAESSASTLFSVDQNMTLIIEDEDDNPPRLQNPSEERVVDVYLKNQGVIQVNNVIKLPLFASFQFYGNFGVLSIFPPKFAHF